MEGDDPVLGAGAGMRRWEAVMGMGKGMQVIKVGLRATLPGATWDGGHHGGALWKVSLWECWKQRFPMGREGFSPKMMRVEAGMGMDDGKRAARALHRGSQR